MAAVDADAHKQLAGRFSIQGFPTLKYFGANKNAPNDYNGKYCSVLLTSLGVLQ